MLSSTREKRLLPYIHVSLQVLSDCILHFHTCIFEQTTRLIMSYDERYGGRPHDRLYRQSAHTAQSPYYAISRQSRDSPYGSPYAEPSEPIQGFSGMSLSPQRRSSFAPTSALTRPPKDPKDVRQRVAMLDTVVNRAKYVPPTAEEADALSYETRREISRRAGMSVLMIMRGNQGSDQPFSGI